LRWLDHRQRAGKLIAIAPPAHRETLEQSWAALAAKF
jgi:acyl-CoA hydrolase